MYHVRVVNLHRANPPDQRLATVEGVAQYLEEWMNEVSDNGRLDFQTGYSCPWNDGGFMAIFRDPQ